MVYVGYWPARLPLFTLHTLYTLYMNMLQESVWDPAEKLQQRAQVASRISLHLSLSTPSLALQLP